MARIEHFAIFANELDALRDFYVETFGLRVILDNSKAPVRGYFVADDGGSVVEIIERPANVPKPETRYGCHVALLVENVPETRAALERRGFVFEDDTAIDTDAFKTAFFRDPDGNRTQIVWRARPLGM